MAAFKLRPGMGDEVENYGLMFRADSGTEVTEEIAEALRKHFMFEEVTAKTAPVVSRETIEAQPVETADEPVAEHPAPVRRRGRQPYPRDADGNIIRPVAAHED